MNLNQTWQDLLSAALVGTGRSKTASLKTGTSLDSVWEQLEIESEKALLSRAASLYLFRQSGAKPAATPFALPTPAEPDPKPTLSPRSQGHLKRMLRGDFREVLPEFLEAVHKADLRIPAIHLPALLNHGSDKALRSAVARVLGPRGHWLAAQNPEWEWAGGSRSTPEQDWQTGSGIQRLEALRELRQTDPTKALELLQTSWASETPEDRAAFLECLEFSLSMADEAFLETVLDDKRKEVRKTAANLLARLPESRLVARMIERVRPLVRLEAAKPKGLIGRLVGAQTPASLQITLPESCDKAMQRDGIEAKNPPYGMGEKTWWLVQMVGMVPPAIWGQPEAWIGATDAESSALLGAWSEAATRHCDREWAEALLEHWLIQENRNVSMHALFAVLPPEKSQQMLIGALRKYPDFIRGSFPSPARWSRDLILSYLEASKGNLESISWVCNQLLELVLHWPTEVAPELEKWIKQMPQDRTWMHGQANKALGLLEFRKSMLEAI